jgi:hypothetical protein
MSDQKSDVSGATPFRGNMRVIYILAVSEGHHSCYKLWITSIKISAIPHVQLILMVFSETQEHVVVVAGCSRSSESGSIQGRGGDFCYQPRTYLEVG